MMLTFSYHSLTWEASEQRESSGTFDHRAGDEDSEVGEVR